MTNEKKQQIMFILLMFFCFIILLTRCHLTQKANETKTQKPDQRESLSAYANIISNIISKQPDVA